MASCEKLFTSRGIILDILKDRGYDVSDVEEFGNVEEFEEWCGDDDVQEIKKRMELCIDDDDHDQIIVMWLNNENLGAPDIRNVHRLLEDKGCKNAIIIVDGTVNYMAKNIIKTLEKSAFNISVYSLIETLYNISKHEFVPEHTICTPTQKKNIMKVYSANKNQLPKIKSSDPMCRHIGAVSGQLIKIKREIESQPGYFNITYRLVV